MTKPTIILRNTLNTILIFSLISFSPFLGVGRVSAQEVDESASTTSQEESSSTTSTSKKKDSGPEYTYNKETGLWENGIYSWNPNTYETRSMDNKGYVQNQETGTWDSSNYTYNPEEQKYQEVIPPKGEEKTLQAQAAASATNAGSNSSNNLDATSTNNHALNNTNKNALNNTLNSNATSGNASVLQNNTAGNALTGDAEAIANILNMLQSSWGLTGDIATFMANIEGNLFGDIMIDPSQLPSRNVNVSSADNLTINNVTDNEINNDVNLTATSGDAAVRKNTTAGNATSGDATALANIINLINSAIAADQSFVGVINILGDFNGDILIPDHLRNLMAGGSNADSNLTVTEETNATINTTTVADINNDLDVTAASGDASVSRNTNAGSATSGNAETNVTIYNLLGKNVSAENGLLVFVNVLGTWVGFIVDAPGSNSAFLGSGNANITDVNNVTVNDTTTNTINNNITVAARTGDATVSENTNAGNARSGNAKAGVNLLNIAGSNLNLSNWFGVLFINVIGSWNGSFGIDTASGNVPIYTPPTADLSNQSVAVQQQSTANTAPVGGGAFSFIPRTSNLGITPAVFNEASTSNQTSESNVAGAASPTQPGSPTTAPAATTSAAIDEPRNNIVWLIALSMALALLTTAEVLRRRTPDTTLPV